MITRTISSPLGKVGRKEEEEEENYIFHLSLHSQHARDQPVMMESNGVTPTLHKQAGPKQIIPLPCWARFYFYGMQGLLDEVVFTALFDLILHPTGNRQLKGCTTLTSFFIYGSCTLFVEHIFLYCMRRGYSLHHRLPVYVIAAYLWELLWGLALRQVGACSWDYSHYPLNFLGLITLVYAPGWLLLAFLQDFVYRYLLSLHIIDMKHKVKLL